MYYYQLSIAAFTVLLTSASMTLALPRSDPIIPSGQTKIHRVATDSKSLQSGTLAVHKAYKKYGWNVPQGLNDAAVRLSRVAVSKDAKSSATSTAATSGSSSASTSSSSGTGTANVQAVPVQHDAEYLCPITIGGQKLNMNFDTGSSDLWVYNPSLGNKVTSGHSIYNPSTSKTSKAVDDTVFYVQYGDKSATEGNVTSDTVSVGDISVQGMAVELPTTVSDNIKSDPNSDGILGLGFQSLNSICKKSQSPSAAGFANGCPRGYKPQPRPTWFESAKSSLKAGLFTANFKKGTAGSFQFGAIDKTAFKAPLTYTSIDNSKGYWSFPSETVQVSGGNPLQRSDANFGIVDSGTSILMLDSEVATAYYRSVPKAQLDDQDNFIFPCDTTLPEFKVAVGNYMATIPGSLLNYAPSEEGDNSNEMPYPKRGIVADFSVLVCFGGIQSGSDQGPQVFGDILFQALFLVFDYDHLQLGLAPHA